ncbi:hypothetical protein [uncultured Roseobacter sp.]|uniref:hypothetical protein n=1 Tax=uncultured Roseobacter sp. TaxID=114847 RepID=UPI00261E686C|nr:hypothetical protein [uncultured Roseobacter sp.]
MKHQKIEPHLSDMPVPAMPNEEIEAIVFRNLDLKERAWGEKQEGSVIILQYPDSRTLWQRAAAWWHLRYRSSQHIAQDKTVTRVSEPVWQGHWATTKYL